MDKLVPVDRVVKQKHWKPKKTLPKSLKNLLGISQFSTLDLANMIKHVCWCSQEDARKLGDDPNAPMALKIIINGLITELNQGQPGRTMEMLAWANQITEERIQVNPLDNMSSYEMDEQINLLISKLDS